MTARTEIDLDQDIPQEIFDLHGYRLAITRALD